MLRKQVEKKRVLNLLSERRKHTLEVAVSVAARAFLRANLWSMKEREWTKEEVKVRFIYELVLGFALNATVRPPPNSFPGNFNLRCNLLISVLSTSIQTQR